MQPSQSRAGKHCGVGVRVSLLSGPLPLVLCPCCPVPGFTACLSQTRTVCTFNSILSFSLAQSRWAIDFKRTIAKNLGRNKGEPNPENKRQFKLTKLSRFETLQQQTRFALAVRPAQRWPPYGPPPSPPAAPEQVRGRTRITTRHPGLLGGTVMG